MPGCTVPGPVSSLSATSAVTQLTISWSPPTVPDGVIIVYELLLNGNGTSKSTINSTNTSLTLTHLPPNTMFTFSVRAYTIVGPGEYVTGQASTKLNVEPSITVTAKVPGIIIITLKLIYKVTANYVTI